MERITSNDQIVIIEPDISTTSEDFFCLQRPSMPDTSGMMRHITIRPIAWLFIFICTVSLQHLQHDSAALISAFITYKCNRFTALWILSGTIQVSLYQKKHSHTHSYRIIIMPFRSFLYRSHFISAGLV